MQAEYDQLLKNNTWTLTDPPNGAKVLKGRWVLNKKYKADGSIAKYKARWVVKGFMQVYGINYSETFASTAKPTTIRLLLYCAVLHKWVIRQYDVKQAFTSAPIDTEIYVEQPHGYVNGSYVCKLIKALYGLKQSARQWQQHLTSCLTRLGYKQALIDTAVYYTDNVIIAVHVDDMLIFTPESTAESQLEKLYQDLCKSLEISDLGFLSEFLGIEVYRPSIDTIYVSQHGYVRKVLTRYNKSNLVRISRTFLNTMSVGD
jgi:hypothetical protein